MTAGIIKAHQLAGYRSHNVHLRGSSHVPLPPHAIADAMDALFQCVSDEPDARIKAIVAPFLFTYIHPLPDGNGRTARFIINALLAEAGVPWTVIPVARSDEYMNALEEASQHENIMPLSNMSEPGADTSRQAHTTARTIVRFAPMCRERDRRTGLSKN
ncbi:Fic family protein [Rhizobium sp. R693]|uniref:Fic family protein n=1 Tax=Rhizobium sp. R693 TaxID=1764276 RepID=UPI001FD9AEA3|nr:Fic family protein [Rhizobium sp. R693]